MQAIIFIGIQATGKSSFYRKHFFNSHVRISMDLLNTRNKESRFLDTCFDTQSQLVIDNTNPTIESRAKYISKARENKYEVIGYYFSSILKEALQRNKQRDSKLAIPEIGIKGCYNQLQLPTMSEGFDKLYFVKIENENFFIEDWKNEI